MTEKVIRDGKVAVLISPGFGAGWSTWAGDEYREIALFHPRFVEAHEAGVDLGDIDAVIAAVTGKDEAFYSGGWRDIEIVWLDQGTRFLVEDYDGSESLRLVDDLTIVA